MPCRCRAARRGSGQGHVVELAAVEPSVETPERPGVRAAGVLADRGLDQAAQLSLRPKFFAPSMAKVERRKYIIKVINYCITEVAPYHKNRPISGRS